MKILKKYKWIILIVVVLLLIVFLFLYFKRLRVILDNKLDVEINSKLYNTDKIEKVYNGKIMSKKELVNTKKLGKKKISIKIRNYFRKNIDYNFNVKIVDTKKPTIKCQESYNVTKGDNIDLLSDVVVEDNSLEKIKAKVVGDYDLNKVGTYNLKYVAVDKSDNKASKKFVLNVLEKQERTSSQSNSSFNTSKGFKGVIKDGITYIDGILIANKTYSLPSSYNPGGLTNEMQSAFNNMKAAAANEGLNIYVVSGFRSYNTQNTLYNNYVNRDGREAADTYSARPGHSEHQTGLAADINLVDDSFEYTAEGKWLNNNAYKYGFILRYPKGKTSETGYVFESWHYRYVGVDLASKLYNGGNWTSLESYFGITSKY